MTCFVKGNVLSIGYDSYWQHDFPLYWENLGDKDSKNMVPEQFSHNLSLSYTMKNGRYNVSFECRISPMPNCLTILACKSGARILWKVQSVFGKIIRVSF